MEIANKRVLIKTWKQIKACSKKHLNGLRKTDDSDVLLNHHMKHLCGTIVELDQMCWTKADSSWNIAPWMIQEVIECPESINETEFTYPMWFKSLTNGQVTKFTALCSGVVIEQHDGGTPVGEHFDFWVPHTDTSVWQQVDEPTVVIGAPMGKYIGFAADGVRYMYSTGGSSMGYAIRAWGTHTTITGQQEYLTSQYTVFDTAKELYQWLLDGED
ncbi:MAG: hypothetical protein U9Q38_06425 [Thermodesulfobacteriota bacterium]|nr:hypothetical protein [Thermodesulfobacteriota bacterium]